MTPIDCALAIAEPGGAWRIESLTLWYAPPPPTDHDTLEADAIDAWIGANPRADAVHLWLMEDDGWEEDDEDDEITAMRQRRRRETLDAPDDVPF
jgi:hypothetical protein